MAWRRHDERCERAAPDDQCCYAERAQGKNVTIVRTPHNTKG